MRNTLQHKNEGTLIRDDLKLINVDHVISNAKLSHIDNLLYIFEDNEAVIKMIINGRNRQRDMCPVPTESRLIGYLTQSI